MEILLGPLPLSQGHHPSAQPRYLVTPTPYRACQELYLPLVTPDFWVENGHQDYLRHKAGLGMYES